MTTTKTFFATRALARASGLPVKDAQSNPHTQYLVATKGRWYVETPTNIEEDFSLQGIFDKAALHLQTQGKKSAIKLNNGSERCLYRGEGGLMCAAGPFIKDKFYSPNLEGANIRGSKPHSALEKSGFPVYDVESFSLLSQLQVVHDHRKVEEWADSLKKVAKHFCLSSAIVK